MSMCFSLFSQDADALKVGVADLINQWVKGSEDGSRCSSPSKPAVSQIIIIIISTWITLNWLHQFLNRYFAQSLCLFPTKNGKATTTLKIYKTKSLIYDFNACCPIPYVFIRSVWVAQKSTFTRVSGWYPLLPCLLILSGRFLWF